ncbi:MAG: hypothetical protein NTY64_15865, partial [Deltaproteobacteria bacterium]|nr:hypothetical protein [Deltaproteobacteria bacterium]
MASFEKTKFPAFLILLFWATTIFIPSSIWGACDSLGNCPPPVIGYTSQQMSIHGTQALKASGGGGGPYQWSIISGGGVLSKETTVSGEDNSYTAPSSNQNCVNNPVIQVTDVYGSSKTVKIAVNAYNSWLIAYGTSHFANCVTSYPEYRSWHSHHWLCNGDEISLGFAYSGCSTICYSV